MSSRAGRAGAVVLIFSVFALSGEALRADTLAEAFAAAYETNPQLISARAGLRATDEAVNQARAGFRPSVAATFDYGLAAVDDSRTGSDRNDPFSASIDASQALYDGGRTINSVRGRIADVSAARARLIALEQAVMLDVVTAYEDVRRDQEFVALARNNVRVISEQLRASEDRFAVGEVTRTDVSQAAARLAEAQANLAAQEGQLERSRQNYRLVVGTEPGTLTAPPPMPQLPATLDEAILAAMDQHPLVLARRFDEQSAARDIRTEIGTLLPRVSLNASVGYNEDGLFGSRDQDRTVGSIGVRAVIPIYESGGANYSRVRAAQAIASRARADITQEARDRRAEVEAAWTGLRVARASIRAGREQVEAARLAFEGVREEAIVGSRTTLDVLDAEQELLNARSRLVSSVRDEYVAGYTLMAAIGALTAAQLGLTVEGYDPEVNYVENNARWTGFERTEDTQWEEFWRP
ncbi:MAG: TolC family outer membrane protein [Rubrimonas sp.]